MSSKSHAIEETSSSVVARSQTDGSCEWMVPNAEVSEVVIIDSTVNPVNIAGQGKRKGGVNDELQVESESGDDEIVEITTNDPSGSRKKTRGDQDQGKELQNAPQESPLLKFLSSGGSVYVASRLLEFVAEGGGGSQAILNLRKVCKTTKNVVDSLTPLQSKRIFFHIPVRVYPNLMDLRNFCPPPCASSLKLQSYSSREFENLTQMGLEYLKNTCPEFMNFWENKMQALSLPDYNSYCTQLLNAFGSPKALKRLECHNIYIPDDPSLKQLERICYYNPPVSILTQLPLYGKGKRVFTTIKINFYSDKEELEKIVTFLQSNLLDTEFEVRVTFTKNLSDYQFKSFVSSVAQCTSTVRLRSMNAGSTMVDRVLQLCPENSREFFQTFKTLELWNLNEGIVSLFKENMLSNLTSLDIRMEEINLCVVDLRKYFESILRYLPASLKSLECHVPPWSPEESLEHLSIVSKRCPCLTRLSIRLCGLDISKWNGISNERLEHLRLPQGAFKWLKSLEISVSIPPHGVMEELATADTLLFNIFRIHEIPLLNFKMVVSYCWDSDLAEEEVQSNCVDKILASEVLCNSLVNLVLKNLPITESYKKLESIVKENQRAYGNLKWDNMFF